MSCLITKCRRKAPAFRHGECQYQEEALQFAADAFNEMYEEQGILPVDKDAPEVIGFVQNLEYDVERGQYEQGVGYERLVIL